jgi:pyridoxal phosphate enzyme (YggS family)
MKFLDSIKKEIIQECLKAHRDPSSVQLLAVTKGRSEEEINTLYNQGVRDFCENRVQEAEEKMRLLPQDIRWHFIGTLQTNKVSKVIGRYVLIHSIDSLALAEKISEKSKERGVITDILIEVHTSKEPTKHGVDPERLPELFRTMLALPNIRIRGLMTMAPPRDQTSDAEVAKCFKTLYQLFTHVRETFAPLPYFSELSMGMSQDFALAIREGATMLRIGTRLFEMVIGKKSRKKSNILQFSGSIKLSEDPIKYQKRIRSEWQ